MAKKILIIGSNGYLGSRLIEFLIFRTDYHITTVSQYYSEFNIFKSSRLVSFECDQQYFPIECVSNYDVIISFAPKYEKLVSYIQPSQTFIFTDPRYFQLCNHQFSFYHLDLINVNGFSQLFDLSRPINYAVYLFKNNQLSDIPNNNNENFLGILDFCRCIEALIIFGRLSRSGSYKICSNLENSLPFNFTYQDTYGSIIRDILSNWDNIIEIKNPISCLLCKHPANRVGWNWEFVVCSNCFHIQRKYKYWIQNETHNDTDNTDEQYSLSHNANENENDILNVDDEIISNFTERYPLCRQNLVNSHNILIVTPIMLEKRWQFILNHILKILADNPNLSIVYTTFRKLRGIHSLFDFIFLPDGIQTLDNPFSVFQLLSNKLFDNGNIILKTSSTIPFLSPIDLSNYLSQKAISFHNTYSLKTLIERYSLYLNKSNYIDNGENIICIISKKNDCISPCVNRCFVYEIENSVYDQNSY